LLSVDLIASTPGRLSVLLLGLCLVGCTSGKDETKKSEPEKAKVDVAPQPEPPQPEPAPTTAVPFEPEPPPEPSSTTGLETPPLEGTDAGATIDDAPPLVEDKPELKTKYGGPRPQKKYGAPPPPIEPGF
jgi:hypothetical protein